MKSNVTKIALISVLTVLFFYGCKDFWHPEGSKLTSSGSNNGGNNNVSNPFHGTWYGNWNGSPLIITFRQDLDVYLIDYFGGSGASNCSYSDSGTSVSLDGTGGDTFLAASGRMIGPNQLELTFHLPGYNSDTVFLTRN